MGWFLTSTSKSGKSGGKAGGKAKPGAKGSWDPARTMRVVKWLVVFAVVVGGVIGYRWVEQRLSAYASQRRASVIGADQVVLVTDRPLVAGEAGVAEHLGQLVSALVSADPLDNAGLERAGRAVMADPWVRELHSVQRVSRGSRGGRSEVIVNASIRSPMARVRDAGGVFRTLSGDGVWLPPLEEGSSALPQVWGVGSPPPQAVGGRWEGEAVEGALALVAVLRDEAFAEEIEAYDASGRDAMGRLRLTLHTRAGGLVRWGLPPGREGTVEVPVAVKLGHLRTNHDERGGIDLGGYVVDVFYDKVVKEIDPALGWRVEP